VSAIRYEIRAATQADQDDLLELASYLDSVNLPHDATAIAELLENSDRSFSGAIKDPRRREYIFVLRDLVDKRAIGTSMVIGQLGRRDAPYIFLDVLTEEKYSATLDKHFEHKKLSIGYSYKGPTEIGGLVMHPKYRAAPERFGALISYVRFLWIAMHRAEVQNEILAELLPPLESDGTSHLWEAVGRHFTGLTYREADRLSKRNKEFVKGLFPDGDIYASLLSPAAQDVIGKVGPQTRGVEKMLRRIGFRYAERIDPFDGGPHFVAPTDEITLIKSSARYHVIVGEPAADAQRFLIAFERSDAPYFVAIRARASMSNGRVSINAQTAAHLGATTDDTLWCLPL
jgi:arginine N-succinyltransferase